MELLNKLPEELYLNVIKYLKHPIADIIENFKFTEPRRPCLQYLHLRLEIHDYDVVHSCHVCFNEMKRSHEMEYEYKFYPVYYCNSCEEVDFDDD